MLIIGDSDCEISSGIWGHRVVFNFHIQDDKYNIERLLNIQELYMKRDMKSMFQYIADNMESE